jgi:hypothetical protein
VAALATVNVPALPAPAVTVAMVALVRNAVTAEPVAIHRTFLNENGQGKAPVDPPRLMLGPCRGGVVRLGEAVDAVMIGEGIETCLAVMNYRGLPAWAALSASGLQSVLLPASIRDVFVLADGDEPGEAAARACARHVSLDRRRVRIVRPPHGMDFNDILQLKPDLEGELR